MEKLYRVIVALNNHHKDGWETGIYVWAYQAEKKKKVIVVTKIREGEVYTGAYASERIKLEDIEVPWVNANDTNIRAGVWCEEEQIEDYIGLLKEKVMSKLNEVIEFWTAGEKNFLQNKDKVEVQYMENR